MSRKIVNIFTAIILTFLLFLTSCGHDSAERGKPGSRAPLTVQVLDIGQGDAILIRTPNQVILVDTGDIPTRSKLVDVLKSQGISILDKVIITHPHADHLGGMTAIMDNFTVKQIYDSGLPTTTALYRQYLTAVQKKNIPFAVLNAGSELDLGGGVILKIFAPEKPFITNSEANNASIVGRLIYGNFSMLLAGDAENESESRMVQRYGTELASAVLKSGHHGSNTSSSPAFLRTVHPEAVIISVGANNDYHHPHPSTLKKYKESKINVWRTDTDGTVTVTSDGESYNISKEK